MLLEMHRQVETASCKVIALGSIALFDGAVAHLLREMDV